MKVTFPRISYRMVLATIASIIVSFASLSCSLNHEEKGSLCIKMPGNSPSRTISSTGSVVNGINSFTVTIRDKYDKDVEKFTDVAPGTTITISELMAGTYTVAIRAITTSYYDAPTVSFYGVAEAVVYGEKENTVNITMHESVNCYLCIIAFNRDDIPEVGYVTSKITGSNGDTGEITTPEEVLAEFSTTTPFGTPCVNYYELYYYFFEPGFTYNIELAIRDELDSVPTIYKSTAKATQNGIQFFID
ncbi:MAG: hypothetical protein IKQ23_01985 [Treponema sp.]|nr:hypothetical protein [Treponema sp.]